MTDIKNLITDNIDIWTSAIKKKSATGRGTSKKIDLTGVKKLRELILELAVCGKLVPQDANDEPADVLLEKIAEEKAQLIADKKIKRQKSLPVITEQEKQFELPDGWVWCYLQDVSTYIQRGKGPKYDENGQVKVISQKCIQWSGFILEPARFISDESLDKYQAERFLQSRDLLWNSTGTGTAGRINLLEHVENKTLVADSHVTVIRTIFIDSAFIKNYITAPGVQYRIEPGNENSLVSGTTNQVELNTSAVMSLEIPIPPLAEQKRIVAKVDELMTLCDQLEQQTEQSLLAHQTLVEALLNTLTQSVNADDFQESWQRIAEHFDILFTTEQSIEQLKQTILQLAVMGKLVPQNPSDEPASVLLEKIAEEKAQLIKDKKLKKQTIQVIDDDIYLYKLPKGWKWTQLGKLTASEDHAMCDGPFGSKLKTEHYISDKGFSVVRLGNIGVGKFLWGKEGYISKEHYEILPNNHIQAGDLIVAGMADPLIRTCEAPSNLGPAVNKADCFKLRVHSDLEKKYISHYLNSHVAKLFAAEENQGMTRQRINLGNCKAIPIPIAPINEQHRIVAKVDELMALCDQIKTRLADAQSTQLYLADAVVENALN